MGVIIQKNENLYLIPVERIPLDISNWKIIVYTNPGEQYYIPGLMIYIDNQVFFIHELTIKDIKIINEENRKESYVYNYMMSSLICKTCGGTGIIDWLEKITKSNQRRGITTEINDFKFKRDNSSYINMLDWHGKLIYSSIPELKIGDEICHSCHGCGIQLYGANHCGHTTIDEISKLKGIEYSYNKYTHMEE